jgi:hypothetical protein
MYRCQMFIWAVLGSPLLIGADIRSLDNVSLALLTAPEVYPLCLSTSWVIVIHPVVAVPM